MLGDRCLETSQNVKLFRLDTVLFMAWALKSHAGRLLEGSVLNFGIRHH